MKQPFSMANVKGFVHQKPTYPASKAPKTNVKGATCVGSWQIAGSTSPPCHVSVPYTPDKDVGCEAFISESSKFVCQLYHSLFFIATLQTTQFKGKRWLQWLVPDGLKKKFCSAVCSQVMKSQSSVSDSDSPFPMPDGSNQPRTERRKG